MGTPNNPQESARELLQQWVRDPSSVPSLLDLQQVGLDVEVLDATFSSDIRPFLDYLVGYKELSELDPAPHPRSRVAWPAIVEAHGLPGRQQYLLVSRLQAHNYSAQVEELQLGVFLSRQGSWLLWTAGWGERGRPLQDESLTRFGDVRQLCEVLTQLVGAGGYHFSTFAPVASATIATGLRDILRKTIDQRETRLQGMRQALDSATNRAERFTRK